MHSRHERRVCGLIREVIGNPFRPAAVDRDWLLTEGGDALRLARAIDEGQNFAEMPRLGSALREAGCDDPDILAHCASTARHARGCWVVDALLGRS